MSDEYLKEKVEGIIEPMVKEILNSLPDDPVNTKTNFIDELHVRMAVKEHEIKKWKKRARRT